MSSHVSRNAITLLFVFATSAIVVSSGFAAWVLTQDSFEESNSGAVVVDARFAGVEGIEVAFSAFGSAHYHYFTKTGNEVSYQDTGYLLFDLTIVDHNRLDNHYVRGGRIYLSGYLWSSVGTDVFGDDCLESATAGATSLSLIEQGEREYFEFAMPATTGATLRLSFAFSQSMVARYFEILPGSEFKLEIFGVEEE